MRSHPRECYKAVFEAAKETLFALAADPKYVGSANIGATGVLHTWGRDLNYHPHLHFIVPGGAIGLDGKSWLSSRVDFLIPVLAASVLFRAKYKAIMVSIATKNQPKSQGGWLLPRWNALTFLEPVILSDK